MSLGTTSRSCSASPPSTPQVRRRSGPSPSPVVGKQSLIATKWLHPTLSSKVPRRTPRTARRGESDDIGGLQLWPTMMMMTRRWTAPTWSTSQPPSTVLRTRRDCQQTNEACLNHAYPIKHKLKNYSMMKNFMTTGSLTKGKELKEDPSKSDTTPFPREDTVMMVYDGRPHLRRRCISNLSPGTPTHYG
jgi:hypothetical protein